MSEAGGGGDMGSRWTSLAERVLREGETDPSLDKPAESVSVKLLKSIRGGVDVLKLDG